MNNVVYHRKKRQFDSQPRGYKVKRKPGVMNIFCSCLKCQISVDHKNVCLSVCRGRPLWRCPWLQALTWAEGRDPSGSRVQYPNPAVPSIPRHSRWIILVHLSAFSEQTLLQAAKGVPYPHLGGTVTHRARPCQLRKVLLD